jgi:peptide-methionine (S)-S-oxide reductase
VLPSFLLIGLLSLQTPNARETIQLKSAQPDASIPNRFATPAGHIDATKRKDENMDKLPDRAQRATFAAGCFWGAEQVFGEIDGVLRTAVGYTGGHTDDPTYEKVCSHATGHAEAVEVWFDPDVVSYDQLVQTFWQIHDPTTLNRQGWDFGDQYRSAIFVHDDDQADRAAASRDREQESLVRPIVTEITPAARFHVAEGYHQKYFSRRGAGACAVTIP